MVTILSMTVGCINTNAEVEANTVRKIKGHQQSYSRHWHGTLQLGAIRVVWIW